jgi:hypothetical protein
VAHWPFNPEVNGDADQRRADDDREHHANMLSPWRREALETTEPI